MDSTQRDVLSRAPLAMRQSRNLAVAWAKRLGHDVRCDLTLAEWVAICDAQRFRCAYCWDRPNNQPLVMEHMIPLSRGGEHTLSNVVLACLDCNSIKSRLTPLEWACVNTHIMVRRRGGLVPGSWAKSGRPDDTYKVFVFRRRHR